MLLFTSTTRGRVHYAKLVFKQFLALNWAMAGSSDFSRLIRLLCIGHSHVRWLHEYLKAEEYMNKKKKK